MTERLNFADHEQLKKLVSSAGEVKMAEPYLLAFLEASGGTGFINYPCRLDSYMGILCTHGRVRVEINLQPYELDESKMLIYIPGAMIRILDVQGDEKAPARVILIACAQEHLTAIKLDLHKVYEEALGLLENPCLTLDDEDYKVLEGYYSLSSLLAESNLPGIDDCIRGLASSLFGFIGVMLRKNVHVPGAAGPGHTVRAKAVFESFLKLVVENHARERNVAFYADKLCFTPKYLSQLIRKVSGKSAPEWIDSFVVLEAKNLLKFSNMSIKGIAYHLNFNSVPVFYKFFKSRTGVTPKEYREN